MNDRQPSRRPDEEEPPADGGRRTRDGGARWIGIVDEIRLPPPGRWWDSIRTVLLFLPAVSGIVLLVLLMYGVDTLDRTHVP